MKNFIGKFLRTFPIVLCDWRVFTKYGAVEAISFHFIIIIILTSFMFGEAFIDKDV